MSWNTRESVEALRLPLSAHSGYSLPPHPSPPPSPAYSLTSSLPCQAEERREASEESGGRVEDERRNGGKWRRRTRSSRPSLQREAAWQRVVERLGGSWTTIMPTIG